MSYDVKVQTRYSTTFTTPMTDSQTTMDVAVAPANNKGFLTVRYGYADQEDIYYDGVVGLQLTNLLRGLSPTALTPTEVIGLKKTHVINSPTSLNTVKMMTVHYVINNKPNSDGDEAISGNWGFSISPKIPGIKSNTGNVVTTITEETTPVNYLDIKASAAGSTVKLSALGADANINIEILGKGTGTFTIPDGSSTKTSAAPTADAHVANKKYVDDKIILLTPNATETEKGVTQQSTLAEQISKTEVGTTSAHLFISPKNTSTTSADANEGKLVKLNASSLIDPTLIDVPNLNLDRELAPSSILLGETVVVNNLLYLNDSDGKWWKVTSSPTTWYGTLGIALEAGNADESKKVLLKGIVSGQTYANINPTFASVVATGNVSVGSSVSDSLTTFPIDNSAGAECVVTGGSVRAKYVVGVPTGNLLVYLVLNSNSSEQLNTPACFKNITSYTAVGAIIASASIAAASFSGVYADLSFSFGATKIPAGAKCYLVFCKNAAVGGNYYMIQGDAAGTSYYVEGTKSWTGTQRNGYMSLTVTSTSPVGYGVKAYTTGIGTHGLTPANPWSRVVGTVTSATTMFFNPISNKSNVVYNGYSLSPTSGGIVTANIGFCPTRLKVASQTYINASSPVTVNQLSALRADKTEATSLELTNWGTVGGNAPALTPMYSSNILQFSRLENGAYIWNTYPAGAGYLPMNAGYVSSAISFEIEAIA